MQNNSTINILNKINPEIAIKIGVYNFINSLPINIPLNLTNNHKLKIFYGSPNEINNLLITGEIDLGSISTYEYLKNKSNFILLEDLSISSQKEVGSVILFSNLSIEELGNKNIAVTHTSSTSVNLLKLLISLYTKETANYTLHYNKESVKSLLTKYDAALFIGDLALINSAKYKNENSIKTYDLANLWYKSYSMPMIFSVCVAQKRWANKNPETLHILNDLLIQCKNLGQTKYFNEVIFEAQKISNVERETLLNYFQNQLSYDLREIEKQSLEHFYCNLKENNLL